MDFSFRIIRKKNQLKTLWSGGSTTQLAIYPEDADYGKRNFTWRVSTAKVEVEKSEFTSLPGISRIIMPLEGTLHLMHEGHHEAFLKPFEQDTFSGDWKTTCIGKATDFNLMLAEGEGFLRTFTAEPESSHELPLHLDSGENNWQNITHVFYFLSEMEITIHEKNNIHVKEGDTLLIHYPLVKAARNLSIQVHNSSGNKSMVIQASILHNN